MATATKKRTAKKSVWPHKCFVDADKELANYNTQLTREMMLDMSKGKAHMEPRFATNKISSNKRGSEKYVFFTYCPICGTKLT